jgi:2,3-diketo-5-methylthio-1-phosphopentane phosphatase
MIRVFVDFDGTITRDDVGDSLFETFGGAAATGAVRQYIDGSMSAVDCFRKECAACGDVDKNRLDAFLDSREIDRTFISFFDFCRDKAMECTILSDGMDYYIERILKRNGIAYVPFFANHLGLQSDDGGTHVRFEPSFPHTDEVCDRCASCKRNHMLRIAGDDDIIVYVGEGYSDRCPARFADVVFAKDALLNYCRRENISCFEYSSFGDIQHRLETFLTATKRGRPNGLRKRRRAELARKEVFMGG